jgi:hypothetical protein
MTEYGRTLRNGWGSSDKQKFVHISLDNPQTPASQKPALDSALHEFMQAYSTMAFLKLLSFGGGISAGITKHAFLQE